MIRHGKDLKITTASNGVLVALAKSCEINIDCDEIEVSSATSGKWKDFIPGRNSWTISVSYIVTAGGLAADILKVGTVVNLKVKDGDTGTPLVGSAIVKTCKVTASRGDIAKGSFSFRGKGPLAPPTT